jgi:hypothetical protein
MQNHLVAAAVAVLILAAAPFVAAQTPEGTWTATKQGGATLQLNIIRQPNSQWGQSIPLEELPGLSERATAAPTSMPVSFRLEREAGTFELHGNFLDGRGAGHFLFRPNREFASTLRSLGVRGAEELDDLQLMRLALARVSSASIREFADLGYRGLTIRELERMAIHGVSPEFVRELSVAGHSDLDVRELTRFRIHGVTPGFIRELNALGYGGLSERQLVSFRIHGVTAGFIREMREIGLDDLSSDTLIRMRIHGVDRELARSRRSRSD